MAGRGLACLGAAWRGEAGNVSRHVAASRGGTDALALAGHWLVPATPPVVPIDQRTHIVRRSSGAVRPRTRGRIVVIERRDGASLGKASAITLRPGSVPGSVPRCESSADRQTGYAPVLSWTSSWQACSTGGAADPFAGQALSLTLRLSLMTAAAHVVGGGFQVVQPLSDRSEPHRDARSPDGEWYRPDRLDRQCIGVSLQGTPCRGRSRLSQGAGSAPKMDSCTAPHHAGRAHVRILAVALVAVEPCATESPFGARELRPVDDLTVVPALSPIDPSSSRG